jgi:hypothetical protein
VICEPADANASAGSFGVSSWSRLPISIDPEVLRRLKEAIGGAMMRWQHVETALFLIAHGLMGPDYTINSITFFHIKSAESKLALVDKLLSHDLQQREYVSAWKPIKSKVSNMIEMRNGLAHFEGFMVAPEFAKDFPSSFPVGVSSHHLDAHSARSGMVKSLTVEAIEQIAMELLSTTNDLIRFARQNVPSLEAKAGSLPPRAKAWWRGENPFA